MNTVANKKNQLINIDLSDVSGFLPHSGAMILLDEVTTFTDTSLTARLTIRNDGLFGDENGVPAWVGIEYMAQAVAAHVGIQSLLAGEPIKLGYLLGTRRYSSNVYQLTVGTALTVHIESIMRDDKLGVFNCELSGDGIAIHANLNVYQPPTDVILKPYHE